MSTLALVIIGLMFLAHLATYFKLRSHKEWRNTYEMCWIDIGAKLEQMARVAKTAITERDEWEKTAHFITAGVSKAWKANAKLRKEVTDQAARVDSLMNGDRHCVNSHRYYTGQGISCPHCGSDEVPNPPEEIKCPECGGETQKADDEGWHCCWSCQVEFHPLTRGRREYIPF